VASSEAVDVGYWAMHPAFYCRILLVFKIASEVGVFLCIVDFVCRPQPKVKTMLWSI
jgi:hypothetical protein